ncbi:MAG: glucosaminidase domain-containing protein, partial [Clostridia bacterium]|nr:glucosaminidase domain-containing protein [Clostridia bacterium]
MDDFDDIDYEEDEQQEQYDDSGSEESIKEKYDRHKENYDRIKDKYDKYKQKKDPTTNTASDTKKFNENLRSSNKVASETGKQASKEGTKQASKEAGKQVGKEASKQAGKEGAKQAGKEVAKQAGKEAAKSSAKVAAQGAASSTGVGVVVAAALEVADRLNKLSKKVGKMSEEAIGVDTHKLKKWINPITIIFAIIFILVLFIALALYGFSETATSDLANLIEKREKRYDKKLILFTEKEIKEVISKNYDMNEEQDAKKDPSYKTILKSYGDDLTNAFFTTDVTSDMLEDVKDESGEPEEDDILVSAKNVKNYITAEMQNFNKTKWRTSSLGASYQYARNATFNSINEYNSDSNGIKAVDGISNTYQEIPENKSREYTIKDKNNKNTLLKIPKLTNYGVNGDLQTLAMTYVDMLEPHMQKWVIPYSIMIDTQDKEFVDSVMDSMYHPAEVTLYGLKQGIKTIETEYYMECYSYDATRDIYKEVLPLGIEIKRDNLTTPIEIISNIRNGENTRDKTIGENVKSTTFVEEITSGNKKYKKYKETLEIVTLNSTKEIAKDLSGQPLIKQIKVKREIQPYDTISNLTFLAGFYDTLEREYKIIPIDETNQAEDVETSEIEVDENTGIGKETVLEKRYERLETVKSETNKYSVSYYNEEQMQELGREISRIEWYQDTFNVVSRSDLQGGDPAATIQSYIDQYAEIAVEDMNESGVLASITLAQGILEGGAGSSALASPPYNNHFGIKAGSSWQGGIASFPTYEVGSDGVRYQIVANFRAYSSAAESFADHSSFIWNIKYGPNSSEYRYRGATDVLKNNKRITAQDGQWCYDYVTAISSIVDGGYCTDPDYVPKICNIIETYKLYEYDRESTWDGTPPPYATDPSGTGTGSGGTSGRGRGALYSYEDMEFAYNQIEKWYAAQGISLGRGNVEMIQLPDGGFGWPVKETADNPNSKNIFRFYGNIPGYNKFHDGIDISTGNVRFYDSDENLTKGEVVVATHNGIVSKVTNNPESDESQYAYIEIKTEDGKFRTHYGCLSDISVSEGEEVTKGQEIGRIGKTGNNADDTELCLHYRIYYKGTKQDPTSYYIINDENGETINFEEFDASETGANNKYRYKESRTYLGGNTAIVEIARQQLGLNIHQMIAKDTR